MIKINFCDFHREYDVNNSIFVDVLKKDLKQDYVICKEPDFLIYSCEGTEHLKYKNCIKIFYTNEPVTPNFNECDYAIAYDELKYENRFFKRPYFYNLGYPTEFQLSDEELVNRKFCNFVYSNDSRGVGAELRKSFAIKLMDYKRIDCPGKILNNMTDAIEPRHGDWRKGKIDFISQYKFTIAFENCAMQGYTTEKLEDPFCAHSIPIYWGNPSVCEYFNPKSFIICDGTEKGITDTINKIIYLDNNDEAYLDMIHQSPMNKRGNTIEDMRGFLIDIFENKKRFVDDSVALVNKRMTIPDYSKTELLRLLMEKIKNQL